MSVHLPPGTLFAGDYRVVQLLSAGGMGAVYVAEQLSTRKLRALKLMHGRLLADESSRRRFEQEAQIGARISSEHVVEVQAAGVDRHTGLPYLVMELLEGETLETLVGRQGPLRPAEVRVVAEQICHALGAAHRAGIVHRDLKPLNVFLARTQRTDAACTVKLLDFGIAKLLSADVNQTAAVGSPLWLAPEQASHGQITPATDVWALGLVAYFLLTGAPFWARATTASSIVELMNEMLFEPIPPASVRAAEQGRVVPPGFDAWFAGCVHRQPAARFPDAHHAFVALATLLPAGGVLAPGLGAPPDVVTALRTAYESGELRVSSTSQAGWDSGRMTGSTSYVGWTDGTAGTSRSSDTRGTTNSGARLAVGPGSASLAGASFGAAAGCLVAAGITLVVAIVFGIGTYVVLQRSPPRPSAVAIDGSKAPVPTFPESDTANPPSMESAAPASAGHETATPPGATPGAALPPPTRTEPVTATAPAPTPPTSDASKGSASGTATGTASAGQPTEELAWKIGHAVNATSFDSCLYSKVTRPSHGMFAIRPVVTVRFNGTGLLGVDVQGTSMYPTSDLINRDTYKPATQAEVDAEVSRVLSCIRGKASGVNMPPNSARGAVAIRFSGSDLGGVSVL
ncbi:MAG: protein kinase [Polyangiaceae bacterium]|nr:protein kinase [Polyangiaceae bacterium]